MSGIPFLLGAWICGKFVRFHYRVICQLLFKCKRRILTLKTKKRNSPYRTNSKFEKSAYVFYVHVNKRQEHPGCLCTWSFSGFFKIIIEKQQHFAFKGICKTPGVRIFRANWSHFWILSHWRSFSWLPNHFSGIDIFQFTIIR